MPVDRNQIVAIKSPWMGATIHLARTTQWSTTGDTQALCAQLIRPALWEFINHLTPWMLDGSEFCKDCLIEYNR